MYGDEQRGDGECGGGLSTGGLAECSDSCCLDGGPADVDDSHLKTTGASVVGDNSELNCSNYNSHGNLSDAQSSFLSPCHNFVNACTTTPLKCQVDLAESEYQDAINDVLNCIKRELENVDLMHRLFVIESSHKIQEMECQRNIDYYVNKAGRLHSYFK